MRDQPDGAALLAQARAALLNENSELSAEERHFEIRMIANAMSIAARELSAGDDPLRAERKALAALFDEPSGDGGSEGLIDTLKRLNWRLVSEIRGGKRDGDPAVYGVLRQEVTTRLMESNPKALAKAEDEGEDG